MTESNDKYKLTVKMLVPNRIVAQKDTINPEILLTQLPRQAVLNSKRICCIKKGGYVLLDFGKEFQGGINITVQDKGGALRIVFGESVSEAMSTIGYKNATNDHSVRDFTVNAGIFSNFRAGNSGFRFVKLEATENDITLGCVQGVFEYRDIEYRGSFSCDDELLNEIWNTAAYTVHLNMQNYLWDGIKRDRLVWVGDMHPETATISAVFGYDECVEKSLDLIRDATEQNEWMNYYPSYSMWWIIIHHDWFFQNGNIKYLEQQKDYLFALTKKIINAMEKKEKLSYFVDWSSNKQKSAKDGFISVCVLSLRAASFLCEVLGNSELSEKCKTTIKNLKISEEDYKENKQISALVSLAGLKPENEINKILSADGSNGISAFLGYYTLQAMANAGNIQGALDVIREYWGAMIKLGATTFWEDFDISWAKNASRIDEMPSAEKNDIHGDFGRFCYEKFRHSLCHGWSSGPAPFLSKYVLGVKIIKPGCKKVLISPNLGDLKWAKGTYPTPYGNIKISHYYNGLKLCSDIDAPKEIEVEIEK